MVTPILTLPAADAVLAGQSAASAMIPTANLDFLMGRCLLAELYRRCCSGHFNVDCLDRTPAIPCLAPVCTLLSE